MNKRYKLISNYPGHKIGDVAYFAPEMCDTNFLWEGKTGPIDDLKIPKDFQPDITPDWFEDISINWTILEFRNLNGASLRLEEDGDYYSYGDHYLYCHSTLDELLHICPYNVDNGKMLIYKIKNSKGIILEIGDHVTYMNSPYLGTIKSFYIDNFNKVHTYTTQQEGGVISYDSNWLKKTTPPKVYVFTTEDGVKIFEGDPYYLLNEDFMLEPYEFVGSKSAIPSFGKKGFSTEQRAKDFMLENKPVFSLKDITDYNASKYCISISDSNKGKYRAFAMDKLKDNL